jgi:hypothetical protein
MVPAGIFTANRKGYPVLTKAHQAIVRDILQLGVQVLVSTSGIEDLQAKVKRAGAVPQIDRAFVLNRRQQLLFVRVTALAMPCSRQQCEFCCYSNVWPPLHQETSASETVNTHTKQGTVFTTPLHQETSASETPLRWFCNTVCYYGTSHSVALW